MSLHGKDLLELIQIESSPQLHDADVANLNDEELIQLTKSTFNPEENDRLHELLDKKNTDHLQAEEYAELKSLLEACDKGMLQKSKALAEKYKRGLS
jgi:membrane-bound lytic murein transglycosylase MltF